jgi:hypothetical protein
MKHLILEVRKKGRNTIVFGFKQIRFKRYFINLLDFKHLKIKV